MQIVTPEKEVIDIIKEGGTDLFKFCYQCGMCNTACPWNRVRNFLIRRTMHQSQLGLVDFESEDLWLCATCNACVVRCPRGVKIIDVWRALRQVIAEVGVGKMPDPLRLAVKNISAVGNPLGEDREKRTDWAKDLNVKTFTKGTEVLYFPCCYQEYDARGQKVARAVVDILNKANVDFGILGNEQSCCGESARKAGNESLFRSLVESNIALFNDTGVTRIVTTSPHCYHTFKNEYPDLGGNFEVMHFTQYLSELLNDGKLKFTKEFNKKVAYHDSCYLGRHNNIYDEPRQILESVPGLELVEMIDSREDGLCCGGGGGRVWEETKKGERFSDIRIEQALETGASTLASACPYCMVMFEDSVLTTEKSDVIEVKDLSEIVQEAL
ncbi:MAG: (Fe-S)-binding protein [Dehalococcoidales bacterium]|nr:(Fe-S)-binding protein [Dehalococcoidales bacterium]